MNEDPRKIRKVKNVSKGGQEEEELLWHGALLIGPYTYIHKVTSPYLTHLTSVHNAHMLRNKYDYVYQLYMSVISCSWASSLHSLNARATQRRPMPDPRPSSPAHWLVRPQTTSNGDAFLTLSRESR